MVSGVSAKMSCPTLSHPLSTAWKCPLFKGFLRQEYWNGLPFLPPEDLPNPGTESASPASPALADKFFTTGKPYSL